MPQKPSFSNNCSRSIPCRFIEKTGGSQHFRVPIWLMPTIRSGVCPPANIRSISSRSPVSLCGLVQPGVVGGPVPRLRYTLYRSDYFYVWVQSEAFPVIVIEAPRPTMMPVPFDFRSAPEICVTPFAPSPLPFSGQELQRGVLNRYPTILMIESNSTKCIQKCAIYINCSLGLPPHQ